MKPRRLVEPGPWVGLVPFAFWLVEAARPRTIVELGTHTGNSFCAFLQAAEAQGLDTKVFAVDHWMGDEHAGLYADDVHDELLAYVQNVYPDRGTMIRSSFDDALDQFDDHSIDILHIDGMHTYEAVRNDFDNWLPKVSRNGLVLLHDTAVRARDFGVWKLLEELSADHRTAQMRHSHGLGVVAFGDQPEPILAFLEERPDEAGLFSDDVFETLGNAVAGSFHLAKFLALSDPTSPNAGYKRAIVENESADSVQAGIVRDEAALRSAIRSPYVETDRAEEFLIPQILATPYFIPAHYAGQTEGGLRSGWALCRHYLIEGERAGLSPSPLFDPTYYRDANADVAASGFGMLEHFVLHGRHEGRPPVLPEGEREEAGDQAEEAGLTAPGDPAPETGVADPAEPGGPWIDEAGDAGAEPRPEVRS